MSNMNNMTSLIFYKKLKLLWGEETYLKLCGRKERIGICWLRTGIWRLRNKRGGFRQGICPMCGKNEDIIHITLKCELTQNLRVKYIEKKYLDLNKNIAITKLLNSKNEKTLNNLGKFLYIIKNKWENITKCNNSFEQNIN